MLHRPFTDEASTKHSEFNRQLHTAYVGAKQRGTETAVHGCHCLGYSGQALGSCTCVTCSKVYQLICADVSVRSFAYYMLLHTQVKASLRGPKLFYKNKRGVC